MKERNTVYATEAMTILDSYLTANSRISDIRLLLGDHYACDKFQRWWTVRKNYKDMCLNDKRNTLLSKASFRRSKCSLMSGHSDEETN